MPPLVAALQAACSGHASSSLTQPEPDAGIVAVHKDAATTHPVDAVADTHASSSKDSSVKTSMDTGARPPPMDTGVGMDTGGCGAGELLCAGLCTHVETDDANCGKCGNICGLGLACNMGTCACPPGFVFCGGTCVDTETDSNNCGMCGNACPAGMPCGGGACGCAAPTTLCGSQCVNESTDDQHCGSCSNICSAGLSCVRGSCGCETGETYCTPAGSSSGSCVNTDTDANNCGACNHACTGGETCVNGGCVCPAGETNCGGTIGCVNLSTSSQNCGTSCPGSICGAPLVCENGGCTCPVAGATYCRGTNSCTNVASDPLNCGTCATSCNGGTCNNGVCSAAPCGPTNPCAAPYTCLASGACGCAAATPTYCGATNTCVNTSTDSANCGSCGHSCGAESCVGGVCSTPPACTLANGAGCTPGLASPCCIGPSICASTEISFGTQTTNSTFENLCCATQNEPCSNIMGACCGYMSCNGTTCVGQGNGHHCVNNGDCADGDCTAQHICGQTCVATKVACQLGDVCCVGTTTNPGEACPPPTIPGQGSTCP